MTGAVPATRTLQVGGTLREKALYIERAEDEQVYEMLRSGAYCNVLTSRQMGKSSLVGRARQRLAAEGTRMITVDLSALGGDQLEATAWYRSLLLTMAQKLRAESAFNAWWKGRSETETMGVRFRAFVEELVLADPSPVVVVLDEVDATRALDFTDDLFLAIRLLHNDRAERPELERLTFCLVGVLLADDLVKTTTRTPYNIGTTVRLSDFGRERCGGLVAYLDERGLRGSEIVDEIFSWTSGQPFLTIALCDKVVRTAGTSVEAFVREEARSPAAFKVHFGRIEQIVRERVAGASRVRSRYLRMLDGRSVAGVPERDEEALLLAGLVHREPDGKLRLRNRIYQLRFDRRWVDAILPVPPTPRWVQALVAALVAGLAGGGVVLWKKSRDWKAAEEVAIRTDHARQEAREAAAEMLRARGDGQAAAIWSGLPARGIARGDTAVGDAARAYWERRSADLETLAGDLGGAGCLEESSVVRAFARARAGGAAATSPSSAGAPLAATLWPPAPLREGTEVARCLERRRRTCDRVVLGGGSLSASCSGKLVVFSPDRPPATIEGSGNRLVRPPARNAWSLGALNALVVSRGDKGRVTASTAKIGLPSVTALAGLAADEGLAVFGTGSAPPVLGLLALDGDALTVRRRWSVTSCPAPSCVVRAVAASDERHVAGLIVGPGEGEKASAAQLVLVREGGLEAFPLDGESPLDLTVGDWRGEVVAAVPLSGRIHLQAWETPDDGSWEATQRRSGLTVRDDDGRARVERLDEAGPQRAARFADVFPE